MKIQPSFIQYHIMWKSEVLMFTALLTIVNVL